MKAGVRYIAIASGPIEHGKKSLVVGIIFRNDYMEGALSTSVDADGTDSTDRIIRMIRRSRFKEQIRILIFNGIALAGLNIIEPKILEKSLGVRIILLNRKRQNSKELVKALKEYSRISGDDVEKRIGVVEKYAAVRPVRKNGFYLQSTLDEPYLRAFAGRAFEALRAAHIIARGVSTGESKGAI